MSTDEERIPVHVFVVLTVGLITFGASALLIRAVNETSTAPALSVAFWRTVFGALVLVPYVLVRGRAEVRALHGRDWLFIAGAALLLSAHFITWITSLYYTSVASATVLVTTSPLFLAVLGFVVLGERYRWPLYGAVVIGVVGAALLALEGPTASASRPLLGNGLALGAALFMTLYLLIGRVVRQRISFIAYVFPLYALIALIVGGAVWVAGAPVWGLEGHVYGLCLLMALGPQLIGHGSFNYALRYVPAVMLGLLSLTEPIGATVGAYFLFGERPGAWGVAGMGVTLIAVALAVWFEQRGKRSVRRGEAVRGER